MARITLRPKPSRKPHFMTQEEVDKENRTIDAERARWEEARRKESQAELDEANKHRKPGQKPLTY